MQSDIDRIHEVLLNLMDRVTEVLDRHGVEYYLGGGCALGAVRHKGFIPWDDDMDLAVFVENLDALDEALSELDPTEYSIQHPMTGPYCRDYYLISKIGTTYVTNGSVDRIQRISLEIFPLYPVPDNIIERKLYHSMMFVFDKLEMIGDSGAPNPVKAILTKTMRYMSSILNLVGNHGSHTLMEPRNIYYKRDMLPKEVYGAPTRMRFEDREYYFPEMIDRYLTKFYGDYMQLPPKEKRVQRQYYALSFDTDYCDYFKRKE